MFREERSTLLKCAWQICGNVEDAEDAVQEAFCRLVKKWPIIACTIENKSAYLHTALHNAAADVGRKRARLPRRARDIREDDVQFQETLGKDDALLSSGLREAINSLPPRQAKIVTLIFVADMSLTDAARIMRISQATAYNYKSLALDRLRVVMGLS